jgi:hypothetical protein
MNAASKLDSENYLRDTYVMHLQLSQYDGLGDGQRPAWSRLDDLYEFCFLGRGEERIRPPLEIEQTHINQKVKYGLRYTVTQNACSQGHPSHTAPLARLCVPHTAQAQIPQRQRRRNSHPRSPRGHISMRGSQAGVGERRPGWRSLAGFWVSRATCSHLLSSFFFF